MKVNLIDGSNIFFICWCVFMNEVQSKEEITPEDEQKFYEIFFMKLKLFLTAKNNIIAFEGKNSRNWRRQFYPEYKANRAKVGDQKFGEYFGKFLNQVIEMLQYLPCKVMKTDNAEGDDIIYTMAKAFSNPRSPADITIISADADLTQICNYFKNVKVFHPSKKTYVKADPDIVLKKTLIGDGSDNIKFNTAVDSNNIIFMIRCAGIPTLFARYPRNHIGWNFVFLKLCISLIIRLMGITNHNLLAALIANNTRNHSCINTADTRDVIFVKNL